MKFAVVGATEVVGACFIGEVMVHEPHDEVVAFVDNLDYFNKTLAVLESEFLCQEDHARIKAVKVDIFNEDSMAEHLVDVDTVVVAVEFDTQGTSS